MRSIIIIGALLIAGAAQAKKLDVAVFSTPGMSVTEDLCGCWPSMDSRPMAFEGRFSSRTYPGSVSLDVTGGVAPYQVTWHEGLSTSFLHVSAMPGLYHVTIDDAAGTRITRSVHVGTVRSYIRRPCLPQKEEKVVEPNCENQKGVQAEKRPDPNVPRHPWTDKEVTERFGRTGGDRGEPSHRGDRWGDSGGSGGSDRGVVNSRPVDRSDNGGTGRPVERGVHPMAR